MKKSVLDEAYEKAKECLRECSSEYGLYASGGKKQRRLNAWLIVNQIAVVL